MSHATIIDVDSARGYEADARVRREYERRIERLSGRYAFDRWSERLVPVGTKGSVTLHFEGRDPDAHFISGARYWRENGRDQILGYSVPLSEEIVSLLDDAMKAAFRAVEKARAREYARRQRLATASEIGGVS
ncbi:MAG: hypothetical protein ACRCSL_16580 [Microbacterium sp.]